MPLQVGHPLPVDPTPGALQEAGTPCHDPYAGLEEGAASALATWFVTAASQIHRAPAVRTVGADSSPDTLASSHIRFTNPGELPENRHPGRWLGVDNWAVRKKSYGGYLECVAIYDREGTLDRKRRPHADAVQKKIEERTTYEVEKLREIAARRSRSLLMWKVRCLNADNMFTLTKRGRIQSWEEAWRLWKLFEQMCSRRFRKFDYVVTIEPHVIDGWHIHFVVRGYYHLNTLRLFWHRALMDQPRMKNFLRDDMSPGNVKMSNHVGGYKKLGKYLAKYLGKTFAELRGEGRVKRFASSKGIDAPKIERSYMPSCAGGEMYALRKQLESEGWKITGMFESSVCGMPMLWLSADMSRGPPKQKS